MTIRVGTWNIGGAHTTASPELFHYDKEDVEYFAHELRTANLDIICLQEAHTRPDGSNSTEEIANILGYEYWYNVPSHKSHIIEGYHLGNAIISRLPITDTAFKFYPYPKVPLFWKDGRPAGEKHTKHLQVARVGDVWIANTHLLPIQLFGYAYDDNTHGGEYAREVEGTMRDLVTNTPLIFCGDFNRPDPLELFQPLRELQLLEALPPVPTRPGGKQVDHILYSPEVRVINSGVQEGRGDHYLCFAELDF